jgi:hypothetical protein
LQALNLNMEPKQWYIFHTQFLGFMLDFGGAKR